jgi:hypothetical protein
MLKLASLVQVQCKYNSKPRKQYSCSVCSAAGKVGVVVRTTNNKDDFGSVVMANGEVEDKVNAVVGHKARMTIKEVERKC